MRLWLELADTVALEATAGNGVKVRLLPDAFGSQALMVKHLALNQKNGDRYLGVPLGRKA